MTTAFVLTGGGSLGAVQALRLHRHVPGQRTRTPDECAEVRA